MGRERRKHRRFSLKWGLILTIVSCWLLPIVIVIGVMGYYVMHRMRRQIDSTIVTSVNNAVEQSCIRIESAIASSRSISYHSVVRDAYEAYLDTGDLPAFYGEINAYLTRQFKYSDNFLATMLFFTSDPNRVYYTSDDRSTYHTIMAQYRSKVHEQILALSPNLGTDIAFLRVEDSVYMVRNVLNSRYRTYAVAVMQLDIDAMFSALKNVVWETGGVIWLNGTSAILSGDSMTVPRMPRTEGVSLTAPGPDGETIAQGSAVTDDYTFSYAIRVNSGALMVQFTVFYYILLGLIVLIIPLLAVAVAFFYRNISRPIGTLTASSKRVEQGEFGAQIKEDALNHEFQYLFDSFNSMSSKLKLQFERIYREELALRDARIMALQSQINPHFLGNTLEIINWEARLAGDAKVSQMIESLSTMLDAAMDRRGRPTVHLSEEMMYVDAYLHIISERLGKRLTVIREPIAPDVLDLQVPRLIMQPIIENAVEHGIQPLQKGEIILRAYCKKDKLILEVENDGGMTREDERRIERLLSPDYDAAGENSYNLGIRNVNQRLRILYGDGCGLTIKMNSKGRAVARIIITAIQQTQSEQ